MRFQGNSTVSSSARIGSNVRIGHHAIIHDHVEIGDNTVIAENCIIGEPGARSYHDPDYQNPPTYIGPGSLIRSGSIIYSDSSFGSGFTTGNMVSIRERSIFGKNCVVGTQSDIQGEVTFGDYCRLNSHVQIASKSIVGNFVFIYPFVVFTNDPHPPSDHLLSIRIGDYTQIAAGTVILPGVTVGRHNLIGANSLVNRNIGDFELHAGSPARKVCDLKYVLSRKSNGPHYPWPYHYDKGLPWEGRNFDEWLESPEGRYYAGCPTGDPEEAAEYASAGELLTDNPHTTKS